MSIPDPPDFTAYDYSMRLIGMIPDLELPRSCVKNSNKTRTATFRTKKRYNRKKTSY